MRVHVARRMVIGAAVAVCSAGCGTEVPRQTSPAPATVDDTSATSTAPGTGLITSPPETDPTTTATTTVLTVVSTTAPSTASGPLALELLGLITVENEHRGGYDRSLFSYPASFGGGCDTREMVLQRDSFTPAQVDTFGCKVVAGDWLSLYDGLTFEQPGELEIDHVVALKEAWDSGAWQWSAATRNAYANDLADVRTLRAVSIATNRSKGDKDPSNWLPPDPVDECRYVGDWVAIKARWNLSMDQSEYGRIRNLLLGQCEGWRVAPIDPVG